MPEENQTEVAGVDEARVAAVGGKGRGVLVRDSGL